MCHCSDSYLGLTTVSPCSERRNTEGAEGHLLQRQDWSRTQTLDEEVLHQSSQQLKTQLCPYKTAQGMAVLKTRQQNLHTCQYFPFRGKKTIVLITKKTQANKQTPHTQNNPTETKTQKPTQKNPSPEKISPNDTCLVTETLLLGPARSISGDGSNSPVTEALRDPEEQGFPQGCWYLSRAEELLLQGMSLGNSTAFSSS